MAKTRPSPILLDIELKPGRPSVAVRVGRWLFEPRAISQTQFRIFCGMCGMWAVILAWAVLG